MTVPGDEEMMEEFATRQVEAQNQLVETALDLFAIAPQCQSEAWDLGALSWVHHFEMSADRYSFHIVSDLYWIDGDSERHPVKSRESVFGSFSELDANALLDKSPKVRCKDEKRCLAIWDGSTKDCEIADNFTVVCPEKFEGEITSKSELDLRGLCDDQREGFAYATKVLSEIAERDQTGNYVINAGDHEYVRFRPQPTFQSVGEVGAIPHDSGPLHIEKCEEHSDGNWCQLSWGGRSGWVNENYLLPLR